MAAAPAQTHPNPLPRPPDELQRLQAAWQPPRGWRLASSVNNTHIGLFYIGTALLFFVAAGVLALLMRAQLARPDGTLIEAATYNQLFTMHGTVMMFLFAVPVIEAVAVYLLPQMLGARDLPFPRLSAYAFWAYAFGGTGFFVTLFFGVAPDGGWFMLPPLSGKAFSPGLGADFWLLGIGFIEISAIAGAIELVVGILWTRTPGMTPARLPVFAWAMLVVGVMVLLAFPAVIAGTALLELERAFDWPFFIAARGGDPLLWQHLFWFFGHPEVYIIFLPAAGLVSMLVPVLARTPLVGRQSVVIALVATGVLSFALWVHHMVTAGVGRWALLLASIASLAVAVPTVLQVFAWIATLWRGQVRRCTSTLFVQGFLALFVLGGLTGVMLAVLAFDRQAHDSYFVVAHLHYVLIGGVVFPLFAALYHWTPLVRGQRLSERLGRWVFWLMFAGFNLAFLPMHLSGLLGMPRRVHTYPDLPGWALLNALSTVGAFTLAAGVALCLADLVRTLCRPQHPVGDPWGAATLEWVPTGAYGVRSMPQLDAADPLWARPTLAAEIEAGAHWLPGNPSGGREALVTHWRSAAPVYLLRLPGDSWLPLLAAAGTAGFFLLLTPGWTLAASACGVAMLAALSAWLWTLDRPGPLRLATIGHHGTMPVQVPVDGQTHMRWALGLLLVVDASVFLSMLYAHLHVAMALDVCPPPGARLPAAAGVSMQFAAWVGAVAAAERAAQRLRSGESPQPALLWVPVLATLAFAIDLLGQGQAGMSPRNDAWSATVAALLATTGLHVVTLLLVAAFVLVRARAGLLSAQHAAPLLTLRLLLWSTGLQALLATALTRALPSWPA